MKCPHIKESSARAWYPSKLASRFAVGPYAFRQDRGVAVYLAPDFADAGEEGIRESNPPARAGISEEFGTSSEQAIMRTILVGELGLDIRLVLAGKWA